jgi:hypothetical protein
LNGLRCCDPFRDLTDEQWDLICPFCPNGAPQTVEGARGGRTVQCSRHPVDPEDWSTWADVPDRCPSIKAATGGLSSGSVAACCGASSKSSLRHCDQGYLDLQEVFIDGSFAPAKQGGARVAKTKRGKGSKISHGPRVWRIRIVKTRVAAGVSSTRKKTSKDDQCLVAAGWVCCRETIVYALP